MPTSKIFETAENFFDELNKQLSRFELSTSLDELLTNYSAAIDKIILREESDNHCNYIGGEFKITCADDENYQCAYSLYFEDADETVHTLEARTKLLEMKHLTKDFQQALKAAGTLKFELDEPSEESRKNFSASKQSQ